jgi:hypothetical protein
MSQAIVNVTLPIVVAKIETVLQDPSYPHPGTTANAIDLRQRLTAYVLRRLPVIYVTLDRDTIQRMGTPSQCYSCEQHRHIDRLIQQGIQTLLHDEPIYAEVSHAGHGGGEAVVTCANHRFDREVVMASDWFG